MKINKSLFPAQSYVIRLYLFAFLVSLANWAVLGIELTPDSHTYIDPAVGLIEHGIYGELLSSGAYYPTAFRTPGTSFFIAMAYFFSRSEAAAIFFTGFLFCFLAPLISLYAYEIGKLFSAFAGGLAYAVVLLHANLHFNAISIMSDLPFAAAFALGNLLLMRWLQSEVPSLKKSLWTGLSIGFTALVRPTGLYWFFGVLAILLCKVYREPKKQVIRLGIVCGTVMVLVVPWMIRNKVVHNTASLETIKGLALLWSIGDKITPSPNDPQDLRSVKEFIARHANRRMYYYYYRGYDYSLLNQAEISNTLGKISTDYIKAHPAEFFQIWKKNFINIFVTQIHYEEWLIRLKSSLAYTRFLEITTPYVPRIATKIYHINLELLRVSSLTLYLLIPGLLILVWRYPLLGLVQCWNILVITGLTAIVQGYDRFRLPIDPIIAACAAIAVTFPLQLTLRWFYASFKRHRESSSNAPVRP